jgi:hypothetical protein
MREDELAELVTRDSLIGVTLARTPAQARPAMTTPLGSR